MNFDLNSIVLPCPTDEILKKKEGNWCLTLPSAYKEFIKKMNGVKPVDASVYYNFHTEGISRFLCILDSIEDNEESWFDISVVFSPMIGRMVYSEDTYGIDVLPIAQLDYGNYLALDYKVKDQEPQVVVWDLDTSREFDPVTYFVYENFKNFLDSN